MEILIVDFVYGNWRRAWFADAISLLAAFSRRRARVREPSRRKSGRFLCKKRSGWLANRGSRILFQWWLLRRGDVASALAVANRWKQGDLGLAGRPRFFTSPGTTPWS